MAVAELCVCRAWALLLSVDVSAEWVVLMRNMLCEVWRDHLLHLFRLVVIVVNLVVVIVVVIVAMHQSGVRGRNLGAP